MDLAPLFDKLVGPWGVTFLLLVIAGVLCRVIVVLWRKLEQRDQMVTASQGLVARNQDLFEESLKVIKDDLVPLVSEMQRRRR